MMTITFLPYTVSTARPLHPKAFLGTTGFDLSSKADQLDGSGHRPHSCREERRFWGEQILGREHSGVRTFWGEKVLGRASCWAAGGFFQAGGEGRQWP